MTLFICDRGHFCPCSLLIPATLATHSCKRTGNWNCEIILCFALGLLAVESVPTHKRECQCATPPNHSPNPPRGTQLPLNPAEVPYLPSDLEHKQPINNSARNNNRGPGINRFCRPLRDHRAAPATSDYRPCAVTLCRASTVRRRLPRPDRLQQCGGTVFSRCGAIECLWLQPGAGISWVLCRTQLYSLRSSSQSAPAPGALAVYAKKTPSMCYVPVDPGRDPQEPARLHCECRNSESAAP